MLEKVLVYKRKKILTLVGWAERNIYWKVRTRRKMDLEVTVEVVEVQPKVLPRCPTTNDLCLEGKGCVLSNVLAPGRVM